MNKFFNENFSDYIASLYKNGATECNDLTGDQMAKALQLSDGIEFDGINREWLIEDALDRESQKQSYIAKHESGSRYERSHENWGI